MYQCNFVFFILFLLISSSFSQTYTMTNGVTNPSGDCYCMTSPGSFSAAVWEDNDLRLFDFQRSNKDLSWEFEVYLGTDDNGGHGMAFVIQGEGPDAAGNGGAPLGYGGTSAIIPSIAIEIDTNPNSFDPTTDDHMTVHLQGNHTNPATGTSEVSLPNMEDGAYHSFSVLWHYDDVTPSNSTLTATLDGIYTISYSFDPSFLFNSFNPIYVGFTSGVNAVATNDHKVSFGTPGDAGSCSAVSLPVEYVSFEASILQDKSVQLDWTTGIELNNDYFEVLRSVDGNLWETIAWVDGAGTRNEQTTYQIEDHRIFGGKRYYQLRQVDFNGDVSYSEIREVTIGFQSAIQIQAYPNPASSHVEVLLTLSDLNQQTLLSLYDLSGREVLRQLINNQMSHTHRIRLELGHLVPGLYYLKAQTNTFRAVNQLVVSG
ncbi:MAG: T9SS type A sorting domain-containing protein [Bacteroidota bacterium]